ncbi:MAG: c-type cytochrome [Saprospiraceae bacterium]
MTNIKITFIFVAIVFFVACGGNTPKPATDSAESTSTAEPAPEASTYDPNRGEGKYTADNLVMDAALNAPMASSGEKISGVKCTSCHKLSDERLVGPGWKGVTTRRTPHWIMNFITNPDPMIDKDPELQAQLELCLVRMPNQSLNETEAREIVEFMRMNDGVK